MLVKAGADLNTRLSNACSHQLRERPRHVGEKL
jgi:hypothetical protein